MTIKVLSNGIQDPQATAPAAEETKPAPEAEKVIEQKESSEESDTPEPEAKEESEDAEGEAEESTEPKADADDKPKKKGGFQRRIDKLNTRVTAAQQEAEYWKQQALKSASETKPEPKVETKSVDTTGKPNPDTFETYSDYAEALADWKVEQKLKERDSQAEKAKVETERQKLFREHSERVKSFASKADDFQEVISEADDIQAPAHVVEGIVTSEHGPALMYELAKDKENYARICALSPVAAARELGKLEASIAAKASTPEKKPEQKLTKAPKPIEPVSKGTSKTSKDISDPNLSQAEYEEIRREQMRKRA